MTESAHTGFLAWAVITLGPGLFVLFLLILGWWREEREALRYRRGR